MKIAFFDAKNYDRSTFEKYKGKNEFEFFTQRLTKETVSRVQGHDAVCAFVNCDGDKEIIETLASHGVKYWFQRSAGYNNIDLEACAKHDIKVFRVPAYSPEGVAEFAMTLLMAINRNIHIAYNRTKTKDFRLEGLQGDTIYGQTIGVLGSGKIGQCFIKIAKGLGARVLVYDQYCEKNVPQLAKDMGFEYASLDEVFKESDFISVHAPLTPDTKYMVNKAKLSLAKKNLVIVNTSRGELVNTSDLLDFLDNGLIRGAGLDVYENEKGVFFFDHSNDLIPDLNLTRLRAHRNVILTSHQAFFTNQALDEIAKITMSHVEEISKGDFSKALVKQADGKVING